MKLLSDAAATLKIPEVEFVNLCSGCEMMGMPQPRYMEDGVGYLHDDEWQLVMDCIIKGNLLNWRDEFTKAD